MTPVHQHESRAMRYGQFRGLRDAALVLMDLALSLFFTTKQH